MAKAKKEEDEERLPIGETMEEAIGVAGLLQVLRYGTREEGEALLLTIAAFTGHVAARQREDILGSA